MVSEKKIRSSFILKKKKSINMDITRDLKLYEAESACVCMSLQSLLLGFKCVKRIGINNISAYIR